MHKLDILRQRCPQRNGYPGEEAMLGIPLYLIAFNRKQRLWMKGQDNHDRFNQA